MNPVCEERIEELSAELAAALLRELQATYHSLNWSHFGNKLKPATLSLSAATSRLGQWHADWRSIELNRSFVTTQGWGKVVEVLKHEMAHQFVSEVLGKVDEPAHGPAFQQVCERLGIDGRAAGVPQGPPSAEEQEGAELRVLERISRLLALAQSPNAHEAQAAASAAQRLMLKYNLDVAHSGKRQAYAYAHLGQPKGRVSEHERVLALILQEHYFVEVIWVPVYQAQEGKRGHVLEACGSRANLEMAAYVHAFLLSTAERLWKEHKKAHDIHLDRDRRTFLAGVMIGFREKLASTKVEQKSQGLVWVGDADLAAFYRQRHPRIQLARYSGSTRTEAHAHGREAGKGIVVHRGITSRSGGGGGLLTR